MPYDREAILTFPISWSTCALMSPFLALLYLFVLRPRLSSLSRLPGPQKANLCFGNLDAVLGNEETLPEWHAKYGNTLSYRGFFGATTLSTIDPKAVSHILVSHSYAYPKPEVARRQIGIHVGKGLVWAEGEVHKRQKHVLLPTFSPAQIRELEPTVYEYAFLLREKWIDLISTSQKPYQVINVLPWLSRATLDIIGSAGFGYRFGALEGEESGGKLGQAFDKLTVVGSGTMTAVKMLIGNIVTSIPVPLQFYKPGPVKIVEKALEVMQEECSRLLVEKKSEASAGGTLAGKDLISTLVRSNLEMGGKDQMSDEEVIAQMTTFLFAGHETTAAALTWLLYMLAKHPSEVQDKLRNELEEATIAFGDGDGQIAFDQLNTLPFLDAVCRETLRLFSPVCSVTRQAAVSDSIPVSGGGSPISISAGEEVIIPIRAFNISKEIFGPDAEDFRPNRWLQNQPGGRSPGVWAGLLTFLGGPRACIGYRFALMELKVLVLVLVCKFRFEERDGQGCGPEFERRTTMVMRPQIKGDDLNPSMPLRVSLI